MRPSLVLLGATAIALASAPARAEERVRIAYEAPPECPREGAFEARIRARTSRFVRVSEGAAREFRVRITGAAPSRGRLVVVSASGEAQRAVEGSSCDEVVSALAFVVALAIDPSAARPAPAPPAPAPPALAPPAPAPPEAPPPPAALPTLPREPLGPRAPPPTARGLAAYGALVWPAAPNPLWGVGGFAELHLRGAVALSFRLGLEYAASASTQVRDGSVAFSRAIGWVEGCVFEWQTRTVALAPCLRASGGTLRARPQDVPSATAAASRPWAATGPLARVRWSPLDDAFFDLIVGAEITMWRDTYRILPDILVHDVPPVSAFAGLGVGYLVP